MNEKLIERYDFETATFSEGGMVQREDGDWCRNEEFDTDEMMQRFKEMLLLIGELDPIVKIECCRSAFQELVDSQLTNCVNQPFLINRYNVGVPVHRVDMEDGKFRLFYASGKVVVV